MPSISLFLLAVAFSGVACDDLFGLKLTTESLKPKANTQYSFHYFVKDDKTGDYKTQQETKEGDSVKGSYTLADPNGDLRTVFYKAGPGKGFEAKVDVSPIKSTERTAILGATTNSALKTTNLGKIEKLTTLESNINRFPGGFEMDISSKPQSTEMGMKFSLKTNADTQPMTDTIEATVAGNKATKKTVEITETTDFLDSTPTTAEEEEDIIEKEIDEAIAMPKLPELVLSDNKTHFKFLKDPEEALLDERISQIARQLAETSLRREYEERKLGHFIPISVASVEPSTASFFSKSFKFTPSPLPVLAQFRIVPQYIYKQTLIPEINNRLPVVGKRLQKTEQWEQETITNPPDILKIKKSEFTIKEKQSNTNYKTTDSVPTSVMPVHMPTFFQFFTPYMVPISGDYIPLKQSEQQYATTVKKGSSAHDTIFYAPVTMPEVSTKKT